MKKVASWSAAFVAVIFFAICCGGGGMYCIQEVANMYLWATDPCWPNMRICCDQCNKTYDNPLSCTDHCQRDYLWCKGEIKD